MTNKPKYEIRYIGGHFGRDKANTKPECLKIIKERLNLKPYLKAEIFKTRGTFVEFFEAYEYVFNSKPENINSREP